MKQKSDAKYLVTVQNQWTGCILSEPEGPYETEQAETRAGELRGEIAKADDSSLEIRVVDQAILYKARKTT